MANADGSVIIEIDANNQRALRSLDRVRNRAERIVDQISGTGDITFSLNVSDAERELDLIQRRIYRLIENNRYRESLIPDLEARRDDLTAQYREAISQDQDDRAQSLAREVTAVNRQIQQQREAIESANRQLDHQREMYVEITQAIQAAHDRTRPEAEQIDASNAREQVMERLRGVSSQIASSLRAAVGSGISAFKLLSRGILTTLSKLNVFSRAAGKLGDTFRNLGSTIKNALVFSVVFQGLSMVRQQLSSYIMANAQFTAALGQLKGVLLTAFQPIYDYIIPALVSLMNVLSSVIAVIGKFISVLFGKTAKQSQANAKALYGQAAATEAAGSAAKEAAGSLASFDEINTIQTENASGGGGGGGGGGSVEPGAPDFGFDYGEEEIKSWGEAFDDFLGTILNNGIPKLRSGLLDFSNWLNEFSRKLYEMFTFPGVKEKVIQIGKDLANAFNEMVNRIDWNLLGHALGAGLNLAILGMVNFLYTFDWVNLGMSLAAFINGAVSEIDWYSVGKLLWSGFKIAIETLAGFIIGLNMPEMAEAASDLIIGFFDSIKQTIDMIHWDEVGLQIATFLANLDWPGMFKSIREAIVSALLGIKEFIKGFFSGFSEETKPFVVLAASIASALAIFWGALSKAVSIAKTFNAVFKAVSVTVGALTSPIGLAVAAVATLAAGFVALYQNSETFRDIVSEAVEKVKTVIESAIETCKKWFISLQNGWSTYINPVLQKIAEKFKEVVIQHMQPMIEQSIELIGNVMDVLKLLWDSVLSPLVIWITGVFFRDIGNALSTIGNLFFSTVGFISDIVSGLLKTLNGILDFLVGVFTGEWQKAWNGVYSAFSGIIDLIKTAFQGAVNFISGLLSRISDTIRNVVHSLTSFGNKGAEVSKSVSGNVSAVNSAAKRRYASSLSEAIGHRLIPMPTIAGHSIPALAQGAVIPPNREFMAVLGDQRHGTNLEAPADLIRQIVREEAGGTMEMLSVLQSILSAIREGQVITVDGTTFGRTAIRTINSVNAASGRQNLKI